MRSAPPTTLAHAFALRRRYSRSVNLERDLAIADSLEGYVPTDRAADLLARVLAGQTTPHAARAWTVTGVYGTGKSACAHFLTALYAPAGDRGRDIADAILRRQPQTRRLATRFAEAVPERGFVRAVATARREPLAHTIVRGLARGAEAFWAGRPGKRPVALEQLRGLQAAVDAGELVTSRLIPELVTSLADASKTGVLIVVDELGKTLEHAARGSDADDLYLLQQLAELPVRAGSPPVLVLGLLHQAFAGYGHGLTAAERAEWSKIQGRFEDVLFVESPEQTLRLIANAIEPTPPRALAGAVRRTAAAWHAYLASATRHPYVAEMLTAERIAAVYPIHPVAALALPTLCAKYAQNDRSLFTFLTSNEPHSFAQFLAETPMDGDATAALKLPDVYDYFIDVGGVGLAARPQFQRWAEVHGAIRDAAGLPPDELAALKTIGALNLVTSSGPVRASRALVLAALCDRPNSVEDTRRWSAVLDRLAERRATTYRQQVDEYRIWEGSDYDVDGAVALRLESDRRPLAELLAEAAPLAPVVAARHSYRTGTLRYFERLYVGTPDALVTLAPAAPDSDGVIAYWVGDRLPDTVPTVATNGTPLAVVPAAGIGALRAAARELAALAALDREDAALQTDGVARREVRQRLAAAREVLDETVRDAFEVGGGRQVWAGGTLTAPVRLSSTLSDLCDSVYRASPVLWNELLNRRELTSQGARARRELVAALVTRSDKPRLGLTGHGPEVSMYNSVLFATGIHRPGDGVEDPWVITPPTPGGLTPLWDAVEAFCLEATKDARTLDQLYMRLQAPPYGVKAGVVPVVVAAVLLYHADDVSLYRDGTFIPALGDEQFELLVKHPHRFAVKHFALTGLRWEVFKQLETVLATSAPPLPASTRNATLLNVVRPLVRFATSMPAVTRKARDLSPEAIAVREALLAATEPDRLIFEALPRACGLEPFLPGATEPNLRRVATFRRALLRALSELQSHYDRVLDHCAGRIREALGVSAEEADLREHLRVRAQYLVGQVIERRLRSFTHAAANGAGDYRRWVESLLMVVADNPADAWGEDDALAFEVNLSDLARRFANLEALQKEVARDPRDGFDARRVTITRPDGEEERRLLWVSRAAERDWVDRQVARLVGELGTTIADEHQRHAVAFALVERLLGLDHPGASAEPATSAAAVPDGRRSPSQSKARGARG